MQLFHYLVKLRSLLKINKLLILYDFFDANSVVYHTQVS